jgi:hypothetical protein
MLADLMWVFAGEPIERRAADGGGRDRPSSVIPPQVEGAQSIVVASTSQKPAGLTGRGVCCAGPASAVADWVIFSSRRRFDPAQGASPAIEA